jgi:hypothetical protein
MKYTLIVVQATEVRPVKYVCENEEYGFVMKKNLIKSSVQPVSIIVHIANKQKKLMK